MSNVTSNSNNHSMQSAIQLTRRQMVTALGMAALVAPVCATTAFGAEASGKMDGSAAADSAQGDGVLSSDNNAALTLDPADISISKEQTCGIVVTPAKSGTTFVSSNPQVASVDTGGTVTPIKAGHTTITATAASGDTGASSVLVESATQSGTVTFDVDLSSYDAGKQVRLWLSVPTTDEYQEISDVTYEAGGDATAEINTDDLGNQMLYVEWGADAEPTDRTVTLSFHAVRQEAGCPELIEEGEPGDDVAQYLEGSSMVNVTDESVQAQAAEITEGIDTYLGKARAVYDWVYDNMVRDNDVVGCGQGDICTLLSTRSGKCTDINSVFVGLCRAAGVPAKEVFGIRMNASDITTNQHCWASFYLPGTGWVPADPADVLKAVLNNDWEKDDPEALEQKEYFWGDWDEKRVQLSQGRDLTLVPAQAGGALNDFGYPYAEVDGEALDYYDPESFVYSVSFEADK